MTPHTSGTTLSAQTRYAAGVREILEASVVAAGFGLPLGSRRDECDKEQFHV